MDEDKIIMDNEKPGNKPAENIIDADDKISIDDFRKLDIRVGKIITAEPHKLARKPMYKLTVDLGSELGQRTIVAGIAADYTQDELLNKLVVCIVNLQPRSIAGIESQGMLLAALDSDKISLIEPDRELNPGSKIS